MSVKQTLNTQFTRVAATALLVAGSSCSSTKPARELRVSVADQKIALIENGEVKRVYGCSTSKFGVGDSRGSCTTPLGNLVIAKKIGQGAPAGAVFKGRERTGEILQPNAPGRDPITSRIIWLAGRESKNSHAFSRYIYIHGTPEEYRIGQPASYGCVRMRNLDVIDLFNYTTVGTPVSITTSALPLAAKMKGEYVATPPRSATRPTAAPAPVVAERQTIMASNTKTHARLGPDISPTQKQKQKTLR